jgi:serine/threonine protein kinase
MELRLKNYTEIEFPSQPAVSPQAKHLISSLLQKQIAARFSPSQALNHPWITRKLDDSLPLTRN